MNEKLALNFLNQFLLLAAILKPASLANTEGSTKHKETDSFICQQKTKKWELFVLVEIVQNQ